MNCLIIAAGHGSRLRGVSDSKPLTPVAGVPLIEHVVRSAAAGGATSFTVVTGHAADRLEPFLAALGERTGLPLRPVRIADWDRPNGHSVLAGAPFVGDDFLLMMADHLFDPAIVRHLQAAKSAPLILAVDADIANPRLDLDDATKVETKRGAIVRIGKSLDDYDAIDTGLFRATPALARAIAAAIAAGGAGSLSEGVQRLADAGEAHVMEIGGAFWLDVDDPPALAKAEALLAAPQ